MVDVQIPRGQEELQGGIQSRKGSIRFTTLSQPKKSRTIWLTSYGPKIIWGNQDTIWPMNPSALKAEETDRMVRLATPKKNFQLEHPDSCSRPEYTYSCGRSSVICEVSPLAMKGTASDRTEHLARSKPEPTGFKEDLPFYILGCGRSTPIWQVSEAAKTAEERSKSIRLAEPKRTHASFQSSREPQWPVSAGAQKAQASARIEHLARPTDRKEPPFQDSQWVVKRSTLVASSTTRILELSRPRPLHDKYLPDRETEVKVRRSALRAHASHRINELSKPIPREAMDHLQFNPDAFIVSEKAKKAQISERINELARPRVLHPRSVKGV